MAKKKQAVEAGDDPRINFRIKSVLYRQEFAAACQVMGLGDMTKAFEDFMDQVTNAAKDTAMREFRMRLKLVQEADAKRAERRKGMEVIEVGKLPKDYSETGVVRRRNLPQSS